MPDNSPVTYDNGKEIRTYASLKDLADQEFGGDRALAWQRAKRYQKRRGRRVTYPDKGGVLRDWNSLADIGRHYGISRQAAQQKYETWVRRNTEDGA